MAVRAAFLGFLWTVSVDAGLDMGARVLQDGRGCSFKVWAPHAKSVEVELRKGTATAGVATLALQQDGNIWHGVSEEVGAGDDYRFAVEVSHGVK